MSTTTSIVLSFGKYQGIPITQAPVDYLQWIANKGEFIWDGIDWVAEAKQELERRGTSYESIIPSHHAIDRFSQRFIEKWLDRETGLSSYLAMLAEIAWNEGNQLSRSENASGITVKKLYDGMVFVFACNQYEHPVALKTVQHLS